MAAGSDIVITGLGVVSPIGLGREAYWQSLIGGISGVSNIAHFPQQGTLAPLGAPVRDFDPKLYVTPRKSLKVMSPEIQMGFTAARLALEDANLAAGAVDPERFGVVFGADMIYCDPEELAPAFRSCLVEGKFDFSRWASRAMSEMFPLWMLKFLPNMPACHIAIANDARGPNNTVVMGEVASLLALAEATRVIERGAADVMITGGAALRLHPNSWPYRDARLMSRRRENPVAAMRPFDLDRDGTVYGDGAAAIVLERRQHAEAGGRRPLVRVVSHASAFERPEQGEAISGNALRQVIGRALERAGIDASKLDHVNASGISTRAGDRAEAQALADTVGNVPVTAPKSYFGNCGAAAGVIELLASVLAFEEGQIPATLNYSRPDPDCPVNVVHGSPQASTRPYALLLNQATTGQAAATVIARCE